MQSITRVTASAALLALALLGSGCAAGDDEPAAGSTELANASTAPSSSQSAASSAASPSPDQQADAENECLGEQRAGLIANSWELVVASQGAADHAEMTQAFHERVESSYDANESSTAPCRGNVELAELQFQASVLQAMVVITGETEASYYADVVDAGNAWFASIENDNVLADT